MLLANRRAQRHKVRRGCTDTNEFNYLVVKTMRSLGVCYLENQARV